MDRRIIFSWILGLLVMCKGHPPPANPPMLSHASMDVGNIISIVIPESPDENINIKQLTGEFRQQLERIKKQSRVSKLEHGLVTLRKVLPEMSREERRKTLPLIRRFLHGKRHQSPGTLRNWTKSAMTLVRPRLTLLDEKRISRDFEESGRRDSLIRRNDLADDMRDDPHRFKVIHDEDLHDDRPLKDDESLNTGKMGDDWMSQPWEDENRRETPVDLENQNSDCGLKQERPGHQKDLRIENSRIDLPERSSRLSEIGGGTEEQAADFSRKNERVIPKFGDSPILEGPDLTTVVTGPKDMEMVKTPNCDETRKTSETFFKDSRSNYSIEGQESSSSEIDQNGRWNGSSLQGLQMNVHENDAHKKKRGHNPYEERRSLMTLGDPSISHRYFRPIFFRDDRKRRFFRSLNHANPDFAVRIQKTANITHEPKFTMHKSFLDAGLRWLLNISKAPLVAIRKYSFTYGKPSEENEIDMRTSSQTTSINLAVSSTTKNTFI